MKDIIQLAVVNFTAVWGDKEANLKRMEEYCISAGKQGADLILFPETALTGYDNDTDHPRTDKMHCRLAEAIPGCATSRLAEAAKKYNMYIIFGMPEKDGEEVYNSAAIIRPDGMTQTYRKLHLPFDEATWAVPGDKPVLLDTPWGPVGITICYDTYCFPELIRYYRAMGARLCLNVTACPDAPCTQGAARLSIPAYAYINYMFIASANLCGYDKSSYFIGGSGVVGPDVSKGDAFSYLGKSFGEEGCDRPGMYLGTIDLSLADLYTDIPIFRPKEDSGRRDWRGDLYAQMYQEAMNQ